jgi:hypothetical protein
MIRQQKLRKEVEVFGVSYDRYVLFQHHQLLTRDLKLKRIVDMPSHGAKAAGSLYSIGFAHGDCHVTLVNPELEMMYGWEKLNLQNRVTTVYEKNVCKTSFASDEFDLAFNFVTWTELGNPLAYLTEMKRIARYVLLVTCNNFQPGYPWHRFLHAIFDFPWTHGQVEYNHITRVRKLFRQAGLKVMEYGAIDTPGWPDPSGPRDVRLHRRFGSGKDELPKEKPVWEVPFLDYVKTGNYPGWMKALGRWDMTFRKGVFKLPLSHLFYVMGDSM